MNWNEHLRENEYSRKVLNHLYFNIKIRKKQYKCKNSVIIML